MNNLTIKEKLAVLEAQNCLIAAINHSKDLKGEIPYGFQDVVASIAQTVVETNRAIREHVEPEKPLIEVKPSETDEPLVKSNPAIDNDCPF